MQHMKKRLALVLAVTMTLSDCGGMTVLATENTAPLEENSISDNNVGISDELIPEAGTEENDDDDIIAWTSSEDTENTETDPEPATVELPALHIGQIKEGEELPSPKDPDFVYDLPVSFETADRLVLFANYSIDMTPEDQKNKTVNWSILRGKKGSEPGTASLLDEEDDWIGYETVFSSPYFDMEEITNEDSEYFQMMELTPAEFSSIVDDIGDYETRDSSDDYDYYIRAAYYPENETEKAEDFYAAATIPFLPQKNTVETQDDMTDDENARTDILPDDMTGEETAVSEETRDDALTDAETADIESDDEETGMEQTSEESVSENSTATEPLSTLSETEDEGDVPPTKENFGVLTLDAENVTLHIDDTLHIRASLEPKNPDAVILWTSSDDATVSVSKDKNDAEKKDDFSHTADMTITALKAGTAKITATCGDMTATVNVNVLAADANEVYDLSGDIWVSGFQKENENLVYTGQKVTQDFQVYYKETLLKEKTDYTLTYRNNINAAEWDSAKAPNVTITLKGQYQGSTTLYYTIYPMDISKIDNSPGETSPSYLQTVNYSRKLNVSAPALTYNKKKLTAKKDFVCDYTAPGTNNLPILPADYNKNFSENRIGTIFGYTVNGTGNYKGTLPMRLVSVDKKQNFASAAVTLSQKQYEYQGTPLSKSEITIAKLKISGKELTTDLYDYTVYAEGIDNAYIMVFPTEEGDSAGYFGFKKVALKLVGDRNMQNTALTLGKDWKPEITFSQKTLNETGGIFQDKDGELLTFGEGEAKESLIEGQDYTVKYTNAKKVGTVTATFTGKGRYKGTFKQRYKIVPNIDKKNFTIRWKNVTREGDALVITYQKGSVVPDFVLLDQNNCILKNKTDYAVKLKDNKAPGSMNCEITGKGNYKGYAETVPITVKNGDISQCTLSAPDKAFSTKKDAWKSKVTVKDANGKTLAAGKDYEKEIIYSYEGMENEQPPEAGTVITVTVKGMGYYAADDAAKSSLTGQYRIFRNNISKLQIVIDNQEYTGKEITLSPSDIHVYASAADKRAKKELDNATSCYEIIEYKNNIKAGTAKATLRGLGEYGGTKTCLFKIQKKTYLTNRVAKIALNKTKLTISLVKKEKETLTAALTPKDTSQVLTNPTVIWTTSNSNIATVKAVKPAADDKNDAGTAADNSVSATVEITAKKAGTVVITAISQDGNKRAACTVTVSVPALKENGQTIRKKTGEIYQLSFDGFEPQEMDTTGITFESDNHRVATVDSKGLITTNRFGMATIKVSVGSSVQQCYLIVERDTTNDDELTESNGVYTYRQESGCMDDTDAINGLLRDAEWSGGEFDTVYIPAGTYHIDAVSGGFGGLVLTDNQNLIMADGATLVALKNNNANSHVIWAFGRSNVTISGGKIIGEREGHKGGGEWGHGIEISGCKNVYISNVEVSQCWGDGIYLGFYDGPNVCSNGVTIENCNLHHNRRNNLSITDVSNVTIRNCRFDYASGTDPQYGIDIEPNAGRPCKNIKIYDSTFTGNKKASLGIMTKASDIRLEGCTLDGQLINWSGTNVVLKNTTVKGGVTGQNAGKVIIEK